MLRLVALALMLLSLSAAPARAACRDETVGEARYVACEFHPEEDDLRLFLNDAAGAPWGDFDRLAAALAAEKETLVFAMNAGMYHEDRSPVGLYVENGAEHQALSTKDGPGNFHLKPNGVFWVDADGAAQVSATDDFSARTNSVTPGLRYATQSGPMLVIKGAIHPRFLPDSDSRKRRNGVGLREDGTVVFALSDTAVTFHEFATYFRDTLKTPNALYLDGSISRLYAPELSRNDPGARMGPIVGVVAKSPPEGSRP